MMIVSLICLGITDGYVNRVGREILWYSFIFTYFSLLGDNIICHVVQG